MSERIIRAGVAGSVRAWAPGVHQGGTRRAGTEDEASAARRRGQEQGFAEGHRAGMAAGQAEVQEQVRRLREILGHLAAPLKAVDAHAEAELVGLVIAVARQVLRRELQADPSQIAAIVHATVAAVSDVSPTDVLRVRVHPEDARLLRELGGSTDGWQILEDAAVARGGCIVETPISRIDNTLDARLDEIAAHVLGHDAGGGDGG